MLLAKRSEGKIFYVGEKLQTRKVDALPQKFFEPHSRVGFAIAILYDDRGVQRQSPFCTDWMLYFASTRHDDSLLRNHQRLIVGRHVHRISHQIIDWSRRVKDGASSEHRAFFHHRAFVHSAIPANHHLIFDDHRHCADWLDHPADLRARRDVALLSDLRATSNKDVRIHHGSFVNVRADVDKHRRHADHAARHKAAIANAGASGN